MVLLKNGQFVWILIKRKIELYFFIAFKTQTAVLKDNDRINVNLQIIRKLFAAGYDKFDVAHLLEFIENYVKFDNQIFYSIFGKKIDDMRQFETEEDILFVLDTRRQLERAEQECELERREKELERQEKERERQEKDFSILLLLKQNMSAEIIAKALNVPVENILQIQEKYKDNNPIDEILKN